MGVLINHWLLTAYAFAYFHWYGIWMNPLKTYACSSTKLPWRSWGIITSLWSPSYTKTTYRQPLFQMKPQLLHISRVFSIVGAAAFSHTSSTHSPTCSQSQIISRHPNSTKCILQWKLILQRTFIHATTPAFPIPTSFLHAYTRNHITSLWIYSCSSLDADSFLASDVRSEAYRSGCLRTLPTGSLTMSF